MAKIQTRTVKHINKKTGKIKIYTYDYLVDKVKGSKSQKFTNITPQVRKRESLNLDQAKAYLDSKSATFEERQIVLNEIKDGKRLTKNQISHMLNKREDVRSDKTKTLLRNLGYTKEEVMQDMGITEKQFNKGKFKKIGNDIEFTVDGVTRYFRWDYDTGLRAKR